MKLEEVFDIVRRKRLAVVSTVDDSVAPEAALVGFALTERNEVVFDTLGTSRKAVNIARRAATALVIGWDNDITVQIDTPMTNRDPRRPPSRTPASRVDRVDGFRAQTRNRERYASLRRLSSSLGLRSDPVL